MRRSGIPQEQILSDADQYANYLRGEYHLCNRQELLPSREDLALVYRFLRGHAGFRYKAVELYYRLMDKGISFARMLVALDVLQEMNLITTIGENGEHGYFCRPNPPKVNLDDSAILTALRESALSANPA
jgi:single-stranded-DNA-specific exonuclease